MNIKDVLLDSQAHRGINRMCCTLAMVFVGFKFLGQLTDDGFAKMAKNNVQLHTKPVGMPHRFECNDYCRDASLPGSPLADLEFQSGHGFCWQVKARVTIVTTNIDEICQ